MYKKYMLFALVVGVLGAQASEGPWQSAFVTNLMHHVRDMNQGQYNVAQVEGAIAKEERVVKAFEVLLQEKIKAEQVAATPKPKNFTEQDPCYQAAFPTLAQAAHKKSNSKKA